MELIINSTKVRIIKFIIFTKCNGILYTKPMDD